MTIETGALEQAFAIVEVTYNTPPSLSSTDGIRHLALSMTAKNNRVPSPQKQGTPDEQQSLPRRRTAMWDLSQIMWEPSGTLGTISNVGKFLKAGFGSQTTPALNTTVASGASATGATLTSGAGLAVGDLMIFTVGSGARREITRLKTVAGAAVTFDALSASPDLPGQATSGINYKLASNIVDTFSVFKYYNAGNFKQGNYGSVVDKIEITFDGTKETMLAISGPSASQADSTFGTVQAKPGSQTTVGSPAAGLTGNVYIDGTAFLVTAAKVTIENKLELRNKEIGTSVATGIAGRADHRVVTVQLTFYLEDTTLISKANSITKAVVRLLIGQTNGSMVGAVMPSVEFEVPDVPNTQGPIELTVSGRAYATAGNDQIFLCEA